MEFDDENYMTTGAIAAATDITSAVVGELVVPLLPFFIAAPKTASQRGKTIENQRYNQNYEINKQQRLNLTGVL